MTERDEQAPKDVHHLHAANVADELLRRYPPSTTGAEDRIETEAAHVIRNLLRAPVDPPRVKMRCKHLKPGETSCGMHNLHCGAPDCMVPVDPPERVSLTDAQKAIADQAGLSHADAVSLLREAGAPERVSEQEPGWYRRVNVQQVSEASATNEYRPWESMGITELAYWKQRYIEARQELGEASALRDELIEALGADDFSPGLDALAGTVRYHEIEDGRWSDLSALYSTLVDIRRRALEDTKEDG